MWCFVFHFSFILFHFSVILILLLNFFQFFMFDLIFNFDLIFLFFL